MNIVVTDGHAVNPGDLSWAFLKQYGTYTVYDHTPANTVTERLRDADIVLTNKTPITEEVLQACPGIKLICVLATGYNVIDCDAAAKRNIPVCNVPAYGTHSVAQFTFALLLALCHRVEHHDNLVHRGRWTNCRDFCFWDTPQIELAGKTLGIIGFGRIGQAVAQIAGAMGMQVLAYNRTQTEAGAALAEYVDLDTLYARSDVISLHCPLTPQTKNMINATSLAAMKDGALLLNTARGPLVDEAAVSEALISGKLQGYAADVVSQEPIVDTNPLLTAPNCILTPHMAWAPTDSRRRILECTQRSIAGFLSGQPVNTVNL